MNLEKSLLWDSAERYLLILLDTAIVGGVRKSEGVRGSVIEEARHMEPLRQSKARGE